MSHTITCSETAELGIMDLSTGGRFWLIEKHLPREMIVAFIGSDLIETRHQLSKMT